MKKKKVLDLFSGVGGLSLAFHESDDFEVVAANEILPAAAAAYRANYPEVKMYLKDIRDFSKKEFEKDFGKVKIDLILGGPPCQSYSTAGKRNLKDPRAELFREYHRLLLEFKPQMFVFENVRGILSMDGGAFFEQILELFRSAGYETQAQILNAADYGAPQIRERVILVGTLPGIRFSYPIPSHGKGKKPYLTLTDALSDLPKVEAGESKDRYAIPPKNVFQKSVRKGARILLDHVAPLYGENLMRIMRALPEGGSVADLPKKLKPTSGFGNSYGRLSWNKPSPTITRNLGTPSSARCIHPAQARALTTREGARLQTFPDTFVFYGSRGQKNLQIGEAVPPVLSRALIGSIRKALR